MAWSKTGNMSVSAAMKTKFYDTVELSGDYLKISLVNFLNTMSADNREPISMNWDAEEIPL